MKKIIFFGDSLIANFNKLNHINNVINMGIGGDKTLELIGRIKAVLYEKPSQLFLLVGINDYLVNQGTWGKELLIPLQKTYDVLLDMLSTNLPQAKVYIFSILPVQIGNVVNEETVDKYNMEIDRWNQFIEKKCDEYFLQFINISSSFKDQNNHLNNQYTVDGIHLNDAGYDIFYQQIKHLL